MTILTTSPELQVPGRQLISTFSLTQSGSNFVRVWCTVAPTGSSLDGKLNSSTDPRNRVEVFEGSPGATWSYTFDKGGKYSFKAQEYLKGSGYGGGYEGDPNNATNEAKIGAEADLTIYIGQRATQPIGPPGNQATLVLWVWNDHIRQTTKASHGEDSPAITAQSPTPAVKTAIESTTVKVALAALAGADLADTATTGDLTTWTHSVWTGFNSHLTYSGVHANDDTSNRIADTFTTTPTQKSFQDFVNASLRLLKQHVTNDLGVASADVPPVIGPDSGQFHRRSGRTVSDRANVPLYESVGTFAEAYGALVDIIRCFNRHQSSADADVHDADIEYSIPPLALLMVVHNKFLTVLASASPAVPPAQSAGVQTLISTAGFKEG